MQLEGTWQAAVWIIFAARPRKNPAIFPVEQANNDAPRLRLEFSPMPYVSITSFMQATIIDDKIVDATPRRQLPHL